MEFPEAEEMLLYILDQERRDKAYQLWLTGDTTESFGDFLDRLQPKKEKVRSREEIFSETDALFNGR